MFTGRWIRWALCSKLFEWIPSLGRASNFPLRATFAGDFADVVLEDEAQELAFSPEDLEQAKVVLLRAMANDYGDTSTYPRAVPGCAPFCSRSTNAW